MPNNKTLNERIDCGGRDRGMGETQGAGAGQRFLPNHETRVQHGVERVIWHGSSRCPGPASLRPPLALGRYRWKPAGSARGRSDVKTGEVMG
jgi:hypothetical protein